MYPFRLLIVRREGYLYTRVVYQDGRPTLNRNIDVKINCCDCVELAVEDDIGTIFLRGDQRRADHEYHQRSEGRVSDDIVAFVERINNSIHEQV